MCQANLQARSLRSHLESAHDIYQQVVVPDDLLEDRPSIRYKAERVGRKVPIRCPFPGCPGKLRSTYMLIPICAQFIMRTGTPQMRIFLDPCTFAYEDSPYVYRDQFLMWH